MNAKEIGARIIAKVEAKTSAARDRRAKKGNATGYLSVWNDAVSETFGKHLVVAPTIKTLGMFKRAVDKLPINSVSDKNDFVTWVVENWTHNNTAVFGRSKAPPPTYPEIPWAVMALNRLYLAYCGKTNSPVKSINSEAQAGRLEKRVSELVKENEILRADNARMKAELTALRMKRRSGF